MDQVTNFIKDRKLKNRKSLLVDSYVECEQKVELQEEVDSLYSKVYKSNEKKYDIHNCNLCYNNNLNENFIILPCSHIFHIKCLVENTLNENQTGIIDESFLNTRCCLVCQEKMEMEDILYIHNKFNKITNENIYTYQDDIDKLDKQMTKIKDELRICYEHQRKLEMQRNKSKQITVTINTLL